MPILHSTETSESATTMTSTKIVFENHVGLSITRVEIDDNEIKITDKCEEWCHIIKLGPEFMEYIKLSLDLVYRSRP